MISGIFNEITTFHVENGAVGYQDLTLIISATEVTSDIHHMPDDVSLSVLSNSLRTLFQVPSSIFMLYCYIHLFVKKINRNKRSWGPFT